VHILRSRARARSLFLGQLGAPRKRAGTRQMGGRGTGWSRARHDARALDHLPIASHHRRATVVCGDPPRDSVGHVFAQVFCARDPAAFFLPHTHTHTHAHIHMYQVARPPELRTAVATQVRVLCVCVCRRHTFYVFRLVRPGFSVPIARSRVLRIIAIAQRRIRRLRLGRRL
jgi:hypothetical protein